MWKRIVLVLVTLLVAGGLSACDQTASSKSTGSTVPARLLVFESQAHPSTSLRHAVIRNQRQARAFAARVTAGEEQVGGRVAQALDRGPSDAEVVLAFVDEMGCDVAGSAELWREGDDFRVKYLSLTPHEECVAPNTAVVAFAVPRDRVPRHVKLHDTRR